MTESAGTSVVSFPVSTAFEIPGVTIERDLGLAFGLVVRSMGAVKSITEIVAYGTAVVVRPASPSA